MFSPSPYWRGAGGRLTHVLRRDSIVRKIICPRIALEHLMEIYLAYRHLLKEMVNIRSESSSVRKELIDSTNLIDRVGHHIAHSWQSFSL
jgi:hypothetical protein